ncbi:MAG TPA: ATP-binding protein, partial [Thermoanaerobaculia bacterium]|nr:ATP-binding protein [Thermoanaerobaculia bacterium]
SRLTQVFWNLLSNALKFTPEPGEIALRSREEGSAAARFLVVEVVDSGIGIEREVLSQIFDAFTQGSSGVSRRYGGLGLGLAISRAIVEQHGGQLLAASRGRGQGAVFTVRLPALGQPQAAPGPAAAAVPLGSPAVKDRPRRILLVEDHADTSEAMAALLCLLGHEVTVADSVAAALAAAAAGGIDLVLSDLGLPDGHGHDLMRELASRHGLPGIALSGYGTEDDIAKSRASGFAAHLTKPIALEALKAAIRQVE